MGTVPEKVVRKIRTHTLWSIYFFPQNHAIYEVICRNMVQPETSMTIYYSAEKCDLCAG
jgi:hypothetical protein